MEENVKSVDSQFIQQHLANERTFLAWARTTVAIVGLGFLAAGVVFRSSEYASTGQILAVIVGVSSVILGGAVISCAAREYFVKRRTINDSTFHAPSLSIWVTFVSLGIINMFLLILVILLLM